jgi:hypothetical protein
LSNPHIVAKRLIETRFSGCLAAFLAGSIVRGEGTATSDLDIVIVTTQEPDAPYRYSEQVGSWPVEFFVHTPTSLQDYFEKDMAARTPSLLQMCNEGIVLAQKGTEADKIKNQCTQLLDAGPAPLETNFICNRRYQLTDALEDFKGSEVRAEILQIAPELAQIAADLWLGLNGYWTGHGKWLYRALNKADPAKASALTEALEQLYLQAEKTSLTAFCEEVLSLCGGPLFNGFDSRLKS